MAFSPDGQRIVSGGGQSPKPGEIKVWDATTGEETLRLKGHTDYVWSVAFSPDGQRIVSGGENKTLKVWDAATGEETLTLTGHTNTPCSQRGLQPRRPADRQRQRRTRRSRCGTPPRARKLSRSRDTTDIVNSVAFSPDGQRIVSGGGHWRRHRRRSTPKAE